MKVTFKTEELQGRLAQLGGVVASKATVPVFGYVRLFTDGAVVKATAMDIEATLTVVFANATADGPVDVLLPFKTLNGVISAVTAPETTIEVQGETKATIRAARLRAAELEPFPLSNLPSYPDAPQALIAQVGLPGFQDQIKSIEFAVPEGNNKFSVPVARLESKLDAEGAPGNLKFIATDGFRLAISTVPQSIGDFALTLPKTALKHVSKLVGGESKVLKIAEVEACFWFYTDTETLTVNRTAGEFPPYERILPNGITTTIEVPSTKLLLQAIQQVTPLADDEKPVIIFAVSEGILSLEAATKKQAQAQVGELRLVGQSDIDVVVTGPAIDFSLDVKMLRPFIEAVQETPLTIRVKTRENIIDFVGANGQTRFLQMPTNPTTRS